MMNGNLFRGRIGVFFALSSVFAISTTLAQAEDEARLLSQHLEVRLEPEKRDFEVTAELQIAGPNDLTLLLIDLATVERCTGAEARHENGWLHLTSVESPERILLTYSIHWPADREAKAFHLGTDEGYVLPESHWFPSEPDGLLGKLTPYSIDIELPHPLSAVGAGRRSQNQKGEKTRTTLELDRPGRAFFVYGNYRHFESGKTEVWLLPRAVPQAKTLTRTLGELTNPVISQYCSLLPTAEEPVTRVVQVTRRGGWGGPQTLLLGASELALLNQGGNSAFQFFWLLSHELAHTWWGNRVVPEREAYGLLVEGMANYYSALAVEEKYGGETARKLWQSWAQNAISETPLSGLGPKDPLYPQVAYYKGAWIHRMLESLVGRDRYLETLKQIVEEDTHPTIASFRSRLEKVSGTDLTVFFEIWFDGKDFPQYELIAPKKSGERWVLWNCGTSSVPPPLVQVDGKIEPRSIDPGERHVFPSGTSEVLLDPQLYLLQKPRPKGRPATPEEETFLTTQIESMIESLGKNDPDRLRSLFRKPGRVVDVLAGLAGKITLEKWSIQAIEEESGGYRATLDLEGAMNGRRIGGPLVLQVEVKPQTVLIDATNVKLRYR